MRTLRNTGLYILLALAVAFAVHVASVALIPRLVMNVALDKISARHGFNAMTHSPRATSASRAIVRPSPDLLYSACPFDLDKAGGVLLVSVSGMPDSYWSISVFDAETNNVFVLNNSEAKNGSADVLLYWFKPGAIPKPIKPPHYDDRSRPYEIIHSPTARGLVLVRTLIDDEKNLATIDKARRHATCAPYRY